MKATELGIHLKLVEVYGAMDRWQLTFVYTADAGSIFGNWFETWHVISAGASKCVKSGFGRRPDGLWYRYLRSRPVLREFSDDVKPISAKLAKTLELSIDDPRLLGVCGRLKCCLMFEMMGAQGWITPQTQRLITPTRPNSPSSSTLPA
jgi:hypothetical protein